MDDSCHVVSSPNGWPRSAFIAPPRARAVMALSMLSGDEHRSIFSQLCNVLDPRTAVAWSSVSHELQEPTQALLQELRADYEAAAALCRKMGLWSCKKLREAKKLDWHNKRLSAADLALLGTLGSVLPGLQELHLHDSSGAAGPDGVQRLAKGLGAGALPAVTRVSFIGMHVGDAGASALAAALGRGALPRLKRLMLNFTAIGDAALVALAPALRRLPALEKLDLDDNPLGDKGVAALVALPPQAGAQPPPTGGLKKLKLLSLCSTQVADAGCAALAAALDGGSLPVLDNLHLLSIPASVAAIDAVRRASIAGYPCPSLSLLTLSALRLSWS